MIFKASIFYDKDDDGIERRIDLTNEEFWYFIKNCKDLNEASEFISLLLSQNPKRKI